MSFLVTLNFNNLLNDFILNRLLVYIKDEVVIRFSGESLKL